MGAAAEEAAVVAVVVHEVVVVAREEEVAVLHEVVVALHAVVLGRLAAAAGHLAVAAGHGALRARRQCRVHRIPRMDAPAEVLVIEPAATGRQRATCRLRAGPAASLETVLARETVPAWETSLIGQALDLVRVIGPALGLARVIGQAPGQAWVIVQAPARAQSPGRDPELAQVRLAAIFPTFSIFQMPGAEMPVVAAYQAAWAVPRLDSAAR